jgi:predicted AlkP superfamily pyrophosphatase or phosphodiesterase
MSNKKIVLILIDGMRPDGLMQANVPVLKRLMANAAYSLKARTVLPSLTLPSIISLMYGVSPQVHGTLTNTFASSSWEAPGLIDLLHAAGYKTASFTNWEQLRDISHPGSLDLSLCINTSESHDLPIGESDGILSMLSLLVLRHQPIDFIFLYLGGVDTAGHMYGWMSPEYIAAIENADHCVALFLAEHSENTAIIVTADHGGLGDSHGLDSNEEMTIPLIITGAGFPNGELSIPVSILDIAPTIAAHVGISAPPQWEGKDLFSTLQ